MHNSIIFELYIDIIALKFTTNAKFEKKWQEFLIFWQSSKLEKKFKFNFLNTERSLDLDLKNIVLPFLEW